VPALAAAVLLAAVSAPPVPATAGERAPRDLVLADATALVPDARLDVRYATADNLTGRPLYPVARCFLLPATAERLGRAAARLRALGLRLVLHDCYRPLAAQRALWAVMPRPGFVADPRTGSNHNRAAAVDLSIEGADGRPVALPTGYDAFVPEARAGATRGVSQEARRNRDLLRSAMEAEGFRVNPAEWWHYDAPEARGAEVLDVPLDRVPVAGAEARPAASGGTRPAAPPAPAHGLAREPAPPAPAGAAARHGGTTP
jgi:D-alanyl-D-alanine dipeptidase